MSFSSAKTPFAPNHDPLESAEILSDWRRYLEDLGTYIWIWDLSTDYVEFTPAWLRSMGYSTKQLSNGADWFSLVHPDDIELASGKTKACLAGESEHFDYEFRLRRSDGMYRWMHSRGKIVRSADTDNHKGGYFIGVYTDTTERHADQHRISTLEKRWNQALGGSGVGVWEWDIKTGETYFSDEWCQMLDLDPTVVEPTIELWRELAHPDDLANSDREIAAYLKGERDRYECECRVRTKSGALKWILDRGVIVERDEDGAPRKLVGTHDDITDRKQQELLLAETQERISRVEKAIPGFFYEYRVKPDGRHYFPYASAGIKTVYGVSPQQAQQDGSFIVDVLHPDDRKDVLKSIAKSAKSGEPWRATYRVIRGGKTYWLQGIANRVAEIEDDGAVVWHGYIVDVTEQRSHDELLEQTTRLIPGAVYQRKIRTDGLDTFPFSTQKIDAVYGLSPEELEQDASRIWDVIFADDRPRMKETIEASMQNSCGWNTDFRIVRDGEIRWLREIVNIDSDDLANDATWYGYVQDITDSKLQELELAEQYDLLQQIAATVPGVLLTYQIRHSGEISVPYISDNVINIFGVAKNAVVTDAHALWTYVHPEDREPLREQIDKAQDVDLTFRILLPKIGEQWRHALANCVTDMRGNTTYYVYVSDATDRMRQEIAARQQSQAIARANEDLEQFNYVAAHDLKEPLRAIRNLSDWIVEDLPEESTHLVEKNARRIRERVDRLQHLVDDLAAYSRAGRQDLSQIRHTKTKKILAQAVDSIDKPNIEFDLTEVDDIEFDTIEVALVTVLKNLISNAMKHHDENMSMVLKVAATRVNDLIHWTIEDNGPGIPREHHARIFKMYQRLNPEQDPSGSGSGLAIVKRTINNAQGNISVESPVADGRGTRFLFTWPLEWPKEPL